MRNLKSYTNKLATLASRLIMLVLALAFVLTNAPAASASNRVYVTDDTFVETKYDNSNIGFGDAGKPNEGSIGILETTGTQAGAYAKGYTIQDGDKITYSISLSRLTHPDYMDVKFDNGINFQDIIYTSVFGQSEIVQENWQVTKMTWVDNNTLRIDLSDLPEYTRQVCIKMTCSITSTAAEQKAGSGITVRLTGKENNLLKEFESKKAYGLRFRIKTVDTGLKAEDSFIDPYLGQYVQAGTYQLYYDKELTLPVFFVKSHDYIYTVVTEDTPDATTEIENKLGVIDLVGLHENTYYLKQISAPDDYDPLPSAVKIDLKTEVKFDPDDPTNKETMEDTKYKEKSITERDMETEDDKYWRAMEKQKAQKEIAEYHNTHPREFVTNLKLDKKAPGYAQVKNTDLNADLILDYNHTNAFAQMYWPLGIGIIAIAIAITIVTYYKRYDKKHNIRNAGGKSSKGSQSQS